MFGNAFDRTLTDLNKLPPNYVLGKLFTYYTLQNKPTLFKTYRSSGPTTRVENWSHTVHFISMNEIYHHILNLILTDIDPSRSTFSVNLLQYFNTIFYKRSMQFNYTTLKVILFFSITNRYYNDKASLPVVVYWTKSKTISALFRTFWMEIFNNISNLNKNCHPRTNHMIKTRRDLVICNGRIDEYNHPLAAKLNKKLGQLLSNNPSISQSRVSTSRGATSPPSSAMTASTITTRNRSISISPILSPSIERNLSALSLEQNPLGLPSSTSRLPIAEHNSEEFASFETKRQLIDDSEKMAELYRLPYSLNLPVVPAEHLIGMNVKYSSLVDCSTNKPLSDEEIHHFLETGWFVLSSHPQTTPRYKLILSRDRTVLENIPVRYYDPNNHNFDISLKEIKMFSSIVKKAKVPLTTQTFDVAPEHSCDPLVENMLPDDERKLFRQMIKDICTKEQAFSSSSQTSSPTPHNKRTSTSAGTSLSQRTSTVGPYDQILDEMFAGYDVAHQAMAGLMEEEMPVVSDATMYVYAGYLDRNELMCSAPVSRSAKLSISTESNPDPSISTSKPSVFERFGRLFQSD